MKHMSSQVLAFVNIRACTMYPNCALSSQRMFESKYTSMHLLLLIGRILLKARDAGYVELWAYF